MVRKENGRYCRDSGYQANQYGNGSESFSFPFAVAPGSDLSAGKETGVTVYASFAVTPRGLGAWKRGA